jgi:glutaredoxin 3
MKKVTIYTTEYCPYCSRAKDLLTRKKISFQEVDLTHDDKKREEISEKTGCMTVPLIFIGDEFIGGSDDLHALDKTGELDRKLKA